MHIFVHKLTPYVNLSDNALCFRGELNCEQILSLRTQLLDQIVQHAQGPRMVLTRLCVAVSADIT